MISQKEYAKRRKRLLDALKPNSIALIASALPKIRSNDTEYPYRQNSDFYYLTGFKEDNSALLLIKGKKETKSILFVQKKDPKMELWTGKRLGVKAAKKHFRVDEVRSSDEFEASLKEECAQKSGFYFQFEHESPFVQSFTKYAKKGYVQRDVAKKIHKMRMIKSDAEIALIKKALKITKKAHHHAMRMQKKGIFEYELQAEFEYIFTKHGAYSDAYTTIVAGGDNANTLHYIKNDAKLRKGELVLIDAGCEYEYYASDITRTIPVGGRFSKAQKELYELVLTVEEKIISMVSPGVLRSKLQQKAEEMLCEGMLRLGILKGKKKKIMKKGEHKKYFPHGIGHFMGIDVHDQNPYKTKNGKEIALQSGMVLTIEPGLYLPKDDKSIPKRYRGIGIRIEDDILVTKKGYENLSKDIAKRIEDIEALYCSS